MERRSWLLLLAALCALCLVAACDCAEDDDDDDDDTDDDDDDDDDVDVDDLIAQGKHWLEVGEGDKARLSFLAALDLVPNHPTATYGLALADALHEMDVVSILYDYVMSFFEGGGPVKGDDDSQGLIDQMLDDVLNGLVIERADELISAAQSAEKMGASFQVEIPMIIGFEELGTAGPDWDTADLLAMQSLGGLLSGLLKHMFVLDLNTNLAYIFVFLDLDTSGSTLETVGYVVDVLIQMLTDPAYPNFLTLDTDGILLYKEAGLQFGVGLDRFLATFGAIALETDDQTDDVLGYVDLNANAVYDQGEPWNIPYLGQLDGPSMTWWAVIHGIVQAMRDTYLDYTVYDVDPANPNPLHLTVFNPVLELLGFPALFTDTMTLDIGSWYLNPSPTGIRDGLLQLLRLLDAFLP